MVQSKVSVYLQFRQYELLPIDDLVRELAAPSRSRLANLAVERFLDHQPSRSSKFCSVRRVKLYIDNPLIEKLAALSTITGIPRAELVRLALREFVEDEAAKLAEEVCRITRPK